MDDKPTVKQAQAQAQAPGFQPPPDGTGQSSTLVGVDAWVVNNALVRFVAQPKPTAGLSKTRCDDVYNNSKKQKEARKEKKRRSK